MCRNLLELQRILRRWPLFLIIVAMLQGGSIDAAPNPCKVLAAKYHGLFDPVDAELRDTHLFPSDLRPLRYETMLAKASGLSLEEVLGVTRNFTKDPVMDGSTGLFRMGQEVVLEPGLNLLNAYARMRDRLPLEQITVDHIVELRQLAMEMIVVGGGVDLVEPKLEFKDGQSYARVDGNIHIEILAKLRDYGYEVEQSGQSTRIRYTLPATGPPPLEAFVGRLNVMVARDEPVERIVAYSVQELLIIHPFKNGNGRTARLLGQILHYRLTGKTILFPEAFHHEMAYSLDELSSLLK